MQVSRRGRFASIKSALLFSATFTWLASPAMAADAEDLAGLAEQAQQTQPSEQAPNAPAPTPTPTPELEAGVGNAIVVTGIRASLGNALDQRRKADVILDGISADDIGSTPDLNLGEALQRVPGVQINRSDERRNATISVRGLPGNLTKTTVQGQNIANSNIAGASGNPFGIFDAALFGGANIIKSFSGDTPAGGLAANADLRLRGALSRKDGGVIRAEVGYEETTQDFLPSVFGTIAHRFGDNFGVYATASYRKESFRRDSININGYNGTYSADRVASFGLDAPTTAGAEQVVLYPADLRQFVLANEGDRLSFGAGLEFKIGSDANFQLDGIYTKRNLDGAVNDVFQINVSDTSGQVNPVIGSDGRPDVRFLGQQDRNGDGILDDIYVTPNFQVLDPRVSAGNRFNQAENEVFAIYPQFALSNDDWAISLIGTYSKATAVDQEIQYNADFRESTNRNLNNGAVLDYSTGFGDVAGYSSVLTIPDNAFFFDGDTNWTIANNGIQAFSNRTVNGVPLSNRITVTGTDRRAVRELWSIDGGIEKFVNFGPFTSFKIGARYDDETARRDEQRNSIYGLQLGNLDQSIITLNRGVTSGGSFFGGQVPGVNLDNFLSIDLDRMRDLLLPPGTSLVAGGDPNPPQVINQVLNSATNPASPVAAGTVPIRDINSISGLYNQPNASFDANNFNSARSNFEAFGMTKFDFTDFLNVGIRGNVGLRYVKTKLNGITDDDLAAGAEEARGSYDAWLPSANLIVDFTDNLVGRAAYYKTFESFDIVEFAPAGTVGSFSLNEDTGFESYRVELSTLDLDPRRSTAFDLGLSWYNRTGSVISLGYFRKNVTATTVREQICPTGGLTVPVDGQSTTLGPLFLDSQNICRLQQNDPIEENNARVTIFQSFNLPESVPIDGFEFQIQQDLSFLPGFWKGFGGVFNFTKIKTGEVEGQRFFNVADFTYNIIGYYENELFEARLAYNYSSDIQLTSSSTFNRGDRTVRGRGQLDFSGAIRPMENLELRFEAFNITNSRREEFEVFEELNRRADYDGRTFSLSATYKF